MGASAGRRAAPAARSAGGLRIGFIGAGNMATALIRGLLESGNCGAGDIIASDIDGRRRQALRRAHGVNVTSDNTQVVRESDVVVVAVKPQVVDGVLEEIRSAVDPGRHLVVSIAAGIPCRHIEERLGGDVAVVRAMPNTPALVGEGVTVLVGGRFAKERDLRKAESVLRGAGRVRIMQDEHFLDAVTGLSGSGPAYVFRFAEALIEGGVAAGLPRDVAEELTIYTIRGAAALLERSGLPARKLREMVTSPGGTTQAALAELERRGFFDAVRDAVVVATRRSIALGRSESW